MSTTSSLSWVYKKSSNSIALAYDTREKANDFIITLTAKCSPQWLNTFQFILKMINTVLFLPQAILETLKNCFFSENLVRRFQSVENVAFHYYHLVLSTEQTLLQSCWSRIPLALYQRSFESTNPMVGIDRFYSYILLSFHPWYGINCAHRKWKKVEKQHSNITDHRFSLHTAMKHWQKFDAFGAL